LAKISVDVILQISKNKTKSVDMKLKNPLGNPKGFL
jgi:hypothetical protein